MTGNTFRCPVCQHTAKDRLYVKAGTEGSVSGRVCYDSDELGRTALILHDVHYHSGG